MMDDPELAAKITKFRCLIDEYEVVAYSDIVDYIEQDDTWDGVWKFKEILDHKIVKANDKDYRGSRFNLKMLWETGEITWEPITRKDKTGVYDTTTRLLSTQLRIIYSTPQDGNYQDYTNCKTQKRLLRLANQASFIRSEPNLYTCMVSRSTKPRTGSRTRQDEWKHSLEQTLLIRNWSENEYDTFSDKGKVIVQDKITRRSSTSCICGQARRTSQGA
jgi:hypothetical protein